MSSPIPPSLIETLTGYVRTHGWQATLDTLSVIAWRQEDTLSGDYVAKRIDEALAWVESQSIET